MLPDKSSAVVTLEVNLDNPLHANNKACEQGIHPGFQMEDRHHQKSKTGVSVAPQKGLKSPKHFFEKITLYTSKLVPRSFKLTANTIRECHLIFNFIGNSKTYQDFTFNDPGTVLDYKV